jgi:hypothetical protein
MLALTPVTTSIVLGGACYVTTKACRYLCTRPDLDGRVASVFDKVRIKCADFQEKLIRSIGEKNWAIFSDIVLDNAWITFLLYTPLFLPLVVEDIKNIPLVLIGGSGGIWAARLIVASSLPPLASAIAAFVAPRPHQTNYNQ